MTERLPCPPAPGPLENYAAEFDALFGTLAQRRGFRELLRSWPFTLDVRRCDLARFGAAFERLGDLTITTLAHERARDPAWLPKLYELHTAVSRDVPIPGHPIPSPPLGCWPGPASRRDRAAAKGSVPWRSWYSTRTIARPWRGTG